MLGGRQVAVYCTLVQYTRGGAIRPEGPRGEWRVAPGEAHRGSATIGRAHGHAVVPVRIRSTRRTRSATDVTFILVITRAR